MVSKPYRYVAANEDEIVHMIVLFTAYTIPMSAGYLPKGLCSVRVNKESKGAGARSSRGRLFRSPPEALCYIRFLVWVSSSNAQGGPSRIW